MNRFNFSLSFKKKNKKQKKPRSLHDYKVVYDWLSLWPPRVPRGLDESSNAVSHNLPEGFVGPKPITTPSSLLQTEYFVLFTQLNSIAVDFFTVKTQNALPPQFIVPEQTTSSLRRLSHSRDRHYWERGGGANLYFI